MRDEQKRYGAPMPQFLMNNYAIVKKENGK
jgi:hypothetical protein